MPTDVKMPIFQTTLPNGTPANLVFTPELPEPVAVKTRDERWFQQHPGATYRVRQTYSDERDQPGRWVLVVLLGPGFRLRKPVKGRGRPSDAWASETARYYREQLAPLARAREALKMQAPA